MNKIFISITGLMFSLSSYASMDQSVPKGFKLKNIFNKDVKTSLPQSSGYTVVDFWASWCQSCKSNLEKLEPIQKNLSSTNSPSQVLAVSVDESREEAKRFFDQDGPGSKLKAMRRQTWLDTNQRLSNQLNFEGVPFLIVVDPKGKIVMRHSGALASNDIKKIQKLINTP